MPRTLLVLLFTLCLSTAANAAWYTAHATWQIAGASPTYTGVGTSQAEALDNARGNCRNAQTIDDWKNFCLNAPTRLVYSESPDGSYVQSCDNCRTENGRLVCDQCKPKLERRELDLASCPAGSPIENCFGDLTCGACKSRVPPVNTTPGYGGDRGVCDKNGQNCHAPYFNLGWGRIAAIGGGVAVVIVALVVFLRRRKK